MLNEGKAGRFVLGALASIKILIFNNLVLRHRSFDYQCRSSLLVLVSNINNIKQADI